MLLAGDLGGYQAGLAFGMVSMATIGPNNLLMIREGLVRGRILLVPSLVCATYLALIAASCESTAVATRMSPGLHRLFLASGLAAICWFAFLSFRAFLKGRGVDAQGGGQESRRACIWRVLRVVLLNPLTYLEGFFIPSALLQSFTTGTLRQQFALALVLVTVLVCYGYSFGGGFVASALRHRAGIRSFDLVSGVILSGLAALMAARLAANLS